MHDAPIIRLNDGQGRSDTSDVFVFVPFEDAPVGAVADPGDLYQHADDSDLEIVEAPLDSEMFLANISQADADPPIGDAFMGF